MVFFKKVEVRDLRDKLGGTQKGLFAAELIQKGENIWHCDCSELDGSFTRQQLLDIIEKHPRLDYFVRSYSYMIEDDLYGLSKTYMEEKNKDECAYFNHSCSKPNCGFLDDALCDNVVAFCDIQPGEELLFHYGLLETEASLIAGMECKCNSHNCSGKLTFDYYRDEEFVKKYYPYMTGYLKQKVLDMQEKWYSSDCYVKRIPELTNDKIEEWNKALFTLKPIRKGQKVASFCKALSEKDVLPSSHFIRDSLAPNCQVIGKDVFTTVDIDAETELTLSYQL